MKKIILLLIAVTNLLIINSCQKDIVAPVNNVSITDNVVPYSTTADISGTIESPITISRIELYIDEAEDMPNPTKYDIETTDNVFCLTILNLNKVTTYYYKYKVYTSVDEMELDIVRSFTTSNVGLDVTFGTQSWTAAEYKAVYYSDGIISIDARTVQGQDYPQIQMALYTASAGTYTDNLNGSLVYNNEVIVRLEYWETKYWKIGDGNYGDWWAENATINVTTLDLTAMEVGMNINATMFEFESILEPNDSGGLTANPELLPSANRRTMTVNLLVPMTHASKAAQLPLNKKATKGSKVVQGRK